MEKEYLEALKSIKIRCHSKSMRYDPIDFDLETIEQALISYANITKQIEEADYKSAIGLLVKVKDNLDSHTYNTILEALLKAQEQDKKKATCWDIVVKKNVDMFLIKKYDNVSDYNSAVWLSGREKLTEEEYDLLKKVYCEAKTTVYTENELRLKILNNPNIQLRFLKDSYPRSNYQITLMKDKIRVDFSYGEFKEDNNSLYLNLCDYGKTWTFMENKEIKNDINM